MADTDFGYVDGAPGKVKSLLLATPQPPEWQRIGDQIKPAFIFARSDFISVHGDTCLHEKNATKPPMPSCNPWASIPGRRLLRHWASNPRSHPWTIGATMTQW
jgi:hypothetical protein